MFGGVVAISNHAWATTKGEQILGELEDSQSNDVNEEVLCDVDEHAEFSHFKWYHNKRSIMWQRYNFLNNFKKILPRWYWIFYAMRIPNTISINKIWYLLTLREVAKLSGEDKKFSTNDTLHYKVLLKEYLGYGKRSEQFYVICQYIYSKNKLRWYQQQLFIIIYDDITLERTLIFMS